jgi:hypothetical protein
MTTILLTLSIIINIGFAYAVYNLLKKYELLEDEVDTSINNIEYLESLFTTSYEKMKEIDERGAFATDDEVGSVFDDLKSIIYQTQNILNNGKKKEG